MKYGYLYTFETAKNVCPQGWHLATVEEYQAITNLPNVNFDNLHKGNVTGFELIYNSGYRMLNGEYTSKNIERFWTSMGYNNLAYNIAGVGLGFNVSSKKNSFKCAMREK